MFNRLVELWSKYRL